MYKCLMPQHIGIRGLSLEGSIDLVRKSGFEGLGFDIREAATIAEQHGPAYVKDLFATAGIRPGIWMIPVDWRAEDGKYRAELAQLPKLAALGRDLGCVRTATFIMPGSDDRPYAENLAWIVGRLRPIAEVLRDQGCRFGLEFIGPKTLRMRFKHEFISTLDGMMEMARTIGTGNVGLLLDAFHLYTSGGSLDDLDRIANADVVVVHVNDGLAGVPRDEQQDLIRALPLETGVIDLAGFMAKLVKMGYDGPVMPEPFSKRVNEIAAGDPLAAAKVTAEYMDRLWKTNEPS